MEQAFKFAGRVWDSFCDSQGKISGLTRVLIIVFAVAGTSLFGYAYFYVTPQLKPALDDLHDLHEIALDYRTYKAQALEVRSEVQANIKAQAAINDAQNTELRAIDRRTTRLEALPSRVEAFASSLDSTNARIDRLTDRAPPAAAGASPYPSGQRR